jgi:tripartite-type tricarboxylate transporter receptor subunit TctC
MKVNFSRRRSLSFLGLLAAGISPATVPAHAQDNYPSRPITLVVPFVAGGTTDIVGRIVADGLSKKLGQPVVVDNRGGAGGNIGAAAVASAKPDGYTLLMGYNGTNAINPSLYGKLSWDPVRSFTPISLVARVNNVVVVNPTLPVKDLPELVSYAKANPGKLNFGSAGPGSIFHLAGEMLGQQTHTTMTHVPYKGAAPALADLMGNQVQVMFSTIPAALPFIKSGQLRAIGVTGPKRSSLFPDLPTAKERGFDNFVVDSWFAVFAPQSLPPAIQTKLHNAIAEVLKDPEASKKMLAQGTDPQGSSAQELADLLAADLKSWKAVVTNAKLSLN